jgi:hypothetical protein
LFEALAPPPSLTCHRQTAWKRCGFLRLINTEITRWAKVAADAGVKAE